MTPLAAPMPWDSCSLEMWSVLLSGGTSVLVDEPYLSAQWLRGGVPAHGISTIWLTSSLFNMIVDEDIDAFRGVREMMIGGQRPGRTGADAVAYWPLPELRLRWLTPVRVSGWRSLTG